MSEDKLHLFMYGGHNVETGTFQKQGDGLTMETAFRPDFESAPGGPLGYTPVIWQSVGETDTTMTVEYQAQ
jgi:hypothetical protein